MRQHIYVVLELYTLIPRILHQLEFALDPCLRIDAPSQCSHPVAVVANSLPPFLFSNACF